MMRREITLLLLAAGCGGEPRADAPPPSPAAAAPADSLALTLGGGAEVWFTRGREARDASGGSCLERTLEIRRDTLRRAVPLLYAREAPIAVDDTLFRATLSRDCAPVGTYRVSVTDGQPHRETP
ncbi:MAG TPA: hypothetical protein VLA95_09795 [Gemmatimonadales bacterium]|nr:hypothetical protein [Gemmatimonadales bacterium]